MKGSICKLKEGKTINRIEEGWCDTVIVEGFASNPLGSRDELLYHFAFINADDMTYQSFLQESLVLEWEVFEEYFEVYMTPDDIRKWFEQQEQGEIEC